MFTGIAKLAHEAMPLEQKARVAYLDLPTRAWLNRCSSERMPFQWTINPYRGCEFGCVYCYARYTHEFMELRDPMEFERRIFAKRFEPREFAKEVRRVKAGEWIAIGTATDPYQPAERRYGLTRAVLEWFSKRTGYRVAVTTKSDLVARDAGLLRRVAERNRVRVNLTITTLDERLARLLEPMAPRPELRLGALRVLAGEGLDCSVMAAPVLPGINDRTEDLERLAGAVKEAGAVRFMGQPLFLKPSAAAVFLPFVGREFPGLVEAYRAHFERNSYLRGETERRIRGRIEELRQRYGLTGKGREAGPEWGQMGLFEDDTARLGVM